MTQIYDPIAISLNFDSLNEAYGFPSGYNDPCFFQGFDRISEIAAKFGVPLSIFVIGKDLQNPEHAARVKDWSEQGHEIGNHSWTHHFNLASLSYENLYEEITKSHDLISETIGKEPKGFIAPTWCTSKQMLSILSTKNYLYDTSSFNSLFLYPLAIKIALNHIPSWKKTFGILSRKDWLDPILKPSKPYLVDSFGNLSNSEKGELIVLPMPRTSLFSPPIWHTLGFIFGWDFLEKKLTKLLKSNSSLYYLIHPADFLSSEDEDQRYKHYMERMDTPLDKKIGNLENIFKILSSSNRKFVTMATLAASKKADIMKFAKLQ